MFLLLSSVHWRLVFYCALGADSPLSLGISYQLSRGVWTKTPATWSEHLCAQGGADGPECQLWRQRRLLELELGCCVKVVWPGCCCLCPLAATALLYCTVTLHRDISVPLTGNLQSALQLSTVSTSLLVLMMFMSQFTFLHFFVVPVSKYLLDFSSYFYWTIFVYSTTVVQLLYTSTQAALAYKLVNDLYTPGQAKCLLELCYYFKLSACATL